MHIHIERERGKGYTVGCKKVFQKSNLCICSGAYGLLQMLFDIFVRFVEDGLEPSQTYNEVIKLLLHTY